jgi:hypothetical protein
VTIGDQISDMALSGRHVRSSLPLLPLHILGIAGGLGLLILAVGLWHGKRRAAQVAFAALALIGTSNLGFGISAAAAAVELGAAGFILLNLDAFRRGSERGGPKALTGPAGLVAGASLYALYAVLAMGATRGTEVDRAITAAGGEAQPLLRMIIAWVPAGLVAGLALGSLTNLGPRARTATLAALAAAVLLIAGAAADSIAITDPLRPHLLPQLARAGTWMAVVLFTLGSMLAGRLERGDNDG